MKRTKANHIGVDVPITNITPTQRLARVRHAVREIYTNTNDNALQALGSEEVNTLYESWLEVCIIPDSGYFNWLIDC